ncbi:MAG: DUF814 domain-containing protein [candidate division Zixibacteria bacterium]|nr:DUF814 domain-containing protein [candidate division Zixibacteria bacterium]
MWLNSLHIHLLVNELRESLVGKLINDIFSVSETARLYLSIGRPSERLWLMYAWQGKACRLNFINNINLPSKAERNSVPIPFRKFKITECEQVNFDRIVRMKLLDEERDIEYFLYFFLAPSFSNLILTDSQSSEVEWSLFKSRLVNEGILELPSPPPLPAPDEISTEYLRELSLSKPELTVFKLLHSNIRGIDKPTAGLILEKCEVENDRKLKSLSGLGLDKLITTLSGLIRIAETWYFAIEFDNNEPSRMLLMDPDNKRYSNLRIYESPSEAIATMGRQLEDEAAIRGLRNSLNSTLERELSRSDKLLSELSSTLEDYENADLYKKYGDLLLANPQKTKGKDQVVVKDIFEEEDKEITIPLDSAKTLSENAASYYKKHKKAKRGLKVTLKRLTEISDRKNQLKAIQRDLANSESADELGIIRSKCKKIGLMPDEKTRRKSAKSEDRSKKFWQFLLSNDLRLYVGRNSKENDELTFGFANKYDLWFHTEQSEGSHVVLKRPHRNYEFPQYIIEQAAAAAAYYSKARNSSAVSVIYTEVRYVRKPKGAPPGKAIYSNVKSLLIEPEKPKS